MRISLRATVRGVLLGTCWSSLLLCQNLPVGNVTSIVASSSSSDILYAGTPAGVFRSSDKGRHWTRLGLASVEALAIDHESPDTLYAASAFGLYKTTNGGQEWTTLGRMNCSHSVAVSVLTPSIVYAGTCGAGVFKSSDSGQSWTAINTGLPNSAVVWELVMDPRDPDLVFAATGRGLFRSTDGGKNWAPSFENEWIYSLAIEPTKGETLYAGTNGRGVLKSDDKGLTWSELESSRPASVKHLAIDGSNPGTVYAATQTGILRTVDGGKNWTSLTARAAFLYTEFVLIDRENPKQLYAGTYGYGLFGSADGGATWTETDSGIQSAGINAIAIPPDQPNVVYAGTDSRGVFKSVDAGTTWTAMRSRYPGRGWMRGIGIDTDSPAHAIYASDLNDGVMVTSDSGSSWSRVPWPRFSGPSSGRSPGIPNAIAFHLKRRGVIHAAAWGAGVFESTDGGHSWSSMSDRLRDPNIDALITDPDDPDGLFAAGGLSIYRSSDSGQNWTRIGTKFRVRAMAVCSEKSGKHTWYAGGQGMFATTDEGQTWNSIGVGLPDPLLVRSLAVDPTHCGTVYAGTEGSGMYKTLDGGRTWHRIGADVPASR